MKILAGTWRGRPIGQPATRAVRPLSEKVRAALFDVVGDVNGAVVLDAYAGSGAAGLEALSRGAAMVEAVEANARVARTIEQNVTALEAHWGYLLHTMTVEHWLALPANQPDAAPGRTLRRYGLIIADPPYAQLDVNVLDRLTGYLVAGGGLAVSHSSRLQPPPLTAAEHIKTKTYGDTRLSFYSSKS